MKPTLILIPGLSGTTTLMQWIAPLLASNYQLCLTELPPTHSKGDQEYEPLCDYIEKMYLNTLSHTPVWILGESFSGPIAITLAKRHPEKIKGVILAASFATCPNRLAQKLQKMLSFLLHSPLGREKIGAIFLSSSAYLSA